MPLCFPCREDAHGSHRSHDSVSIRRKGLAVGVRRIECACVCLQPDDWRGYPTALPRRV